MSVRQVVSAFTKTSKMIFFLSRALIVIGSILCLASIFSGCLGLGDRTDFIFYQLWYLSRRSALFGGAILVSIGCGILMERIVIQIGRTLFQNLRSPIGAFKTALPRELSDCSSQKSWSGFLRTLASQLMLAIPIAVLAFWLNRENLLSYIDGQYLLTLMRNRSEFSDWSFGLSYNPLQGLGDIWYFANTKWIPEFVVGRLVSDVRWQRVLIFSVSYVEIFVAISSLAYWLGSRAAKAVTAGWLAVFMIMPLTFPSLIYNVTPDSPLFSSFVLVPLLIVVLISSIGRSMNWIDALRSILIGFLFWYHFVAFGIFTALSYPFIAVAGTVFLVSSWPERKEFWRKLVWSGLIIVSLVLSGLPEILLGLLRDSAFNSYFQELTPLGHFLNEGSIMLRVSEPVGLTVAWIGFVGAVYHAIWDRGRTRWFALAAAITVIGILLASVLYAFSGFTSAKPIYYEYVLWPIYPIFATSFLSAVWMTTWPYLSNALARFNVNSGRVLWLALPLIALALLHGPNYLRGNHNDRPNVYPPAPTALTEYLRDEVGLVPGASFRGRVVTLTGQRLPSGATWNQMFEIDVGLIHQFGNDHRTIGLWFYNIPTLIEFSHTISSTLYGVVRSGLAYDSDVQVRNILNMRRPNVDLLRALGVRYIITDDPRPTVGANRVREILLSEPKTKIAVDEIPNPNLGVSPTQILIQNLIGKRPDLMEDVGDFNNLAVLDGADPGRLLPASDIKITIDAAGINVTAKSAGRSLVVIPFQFSHCLQAIALDGNQPPEVRRADLVLTGLLFSEQLNATIRYRQGPFQEPWCRFDDIIDNLKSGLIH